VFGVQGSSSWLHVSQLGCTGLPRLLSCAGLLSGCLDDEVCCRPYRCISSAAKQQLPCVAASSWWVFWLAMCVDFPMQGQQPALHLAWQPGTWQAPAAAEAFATRSVCCGSLHQSSKYVCCFVRQPEPSHLVGRPKLVLSMSCWCCPGGTLYYGVQRCISTFRQCCTGVSCPTLVAPFWTIQYHYTAVIGR